MAYHDQFPTNWDTALIKPSFSFIQERDANHHDPSMELMMNEQQCILASLNYHPSLLENSNLRSTYQSMTNNSISYDSNLIIIQQQQQQQQEEEEQVPELHGKLLGNSGQMTDGDVENYNVSCKKRKAEDCGVGAESSTLTTCVSEMGTTMAKNKQKSRKGKGKEKGEDKKSRDVVHVRARSGQATGSHSLAERVRRERINKKMKCLQDMVPGCYKSMGMATMLDEIINYVQSLQNQVEFLSMKLAGAAASALYHDYYYNNRSETEHAMEKLEQQGQQQLHKVFNGGCVDQQQQEALEALALFHSSSTVWSN